VRLSHSPITSLPIRHGCSVPLGFQAADRANYKAWCAKRKLLAMPATPEVRGDYLLAAAEGNAMLTVGGQITGLILGVAAIRSILSIARSHGPRPTSN
jgi:hypothetical protein